MNKVVGVFALVSVALVSFVIWKMSKPPVMDTSGITFYYSTTCVHCQEVEKFLTEQKASEKITIERKEISVPANLAELNQAVQYCKLDSAQGIGVPFVFAEGKCYMGGPDVTNYFKQKLGVSVEPATSNATITPTSTVSASPAAKK